ncbi:GntR family transcriptional regulator [Streptomyces sp. NPDC046716]|uniref:GntR family transcriptional regulator n=1 Tax=Streptomyces sp. NPDC046716 TaxID=3157093 RepID=UPI0033DEC2D1
MRMTGVEQARPRVAPFAVPEQRGAASPGRPERSRGEHTHSEPPAPRVPVARTSVRGQVLEALRAALLSGELAPGEVYSAPVLGERFGVSATPVREAMQLLAREGAVEVVPNRGFRVAERSARELAELAEVRALIEVPVVLRLARAVPVGRWASLRGAAEETVAAAACGDVARYAEVDRAFHRALLGLGGNEELVRVADDLRRRIVWSACDLAVDAGEHVSLLDALESQDAASLHHVLDSHYDT